MKKNLKEFEKESSTDKISVILLRKPQKVTIFTPVFFIIHY